MGCTFSPLAAPEIGGAFATALLQTAEPSERPDTDALFGALYSELHRLARRQLSRRIAPGALGVTTVLHEAYLNISARSDRSYPDQARFMGYAARVMRGIIIDHARRDGAAKRGGDFHITSLDGDSAQTPAVAEELAAIGGALDRLAEVEPELAEVVDLKFFCGLSFAEIAALHNLSERTVQRRWEKARIYLRRSLSQEKGGALCLR